MKIKCVTREQVEQALAAANQQFANNLTFNRFDAANRAGTSYNVTLKVKDSRGWGVLLGHDFKRKTSAACWHAHSTFLNALPDQARIDSIAGRDLGPHDDLQIRCGSMLEPCFLSDRCEC